MQMQIKINLHDRINFIVEVLGMIGNNFGFSSFMLRNKKDGSSYPKTSLLFVLFFLFSSGKVKADIYFNPRFLADDPSAVADLSSFESGLEVPPGTYRVDI